MEEPSGEFIDITNHPRKRKKNEESWTKKQAKQRRNSGEGKLTFFDEYTVCSPIHMIWAEIVVGMSNLLLN